MIYGRLLSWSLRFCSKKRKKRSPLKTLVLQNTADAAAVLTDEGEDDYFLKLMKAMQLSSSKTSATAAPKPADQQQKVPAHLSISVCLLWDFVSHRNFSLVQTRNVKRWRVHNLQWEFSRLDKQNIPASVTRNFKLLKSDATPFVFRGKKIGSFSLLSGNSTEQFRLFLRPVINTLELVFHWPKLVHCELVQCASWCFNQTQSDSFLPPLPSLVPEGKAVYFIVSSVVFLLYKVHLLFCHSTWKFADHIYCKASTPHAIQKYRM